jgi:hypothetical protein
MVFVYFVFLPFTILNSDKSETIGDDKNATGIPGEKKETRKVDSISG